MSFTSIETANRMAAVEKKRKQGGDVMGTLTLRDYFAAKAMQVLMAEVDGPNDDVPGAPRWLQEEAASLAYQMADAMLEARK